MKLIKLLLVIMSATVITLALSGTGLAFHDDGVAHCDGCHTMHNSANGLPMPDVIPGGDYLLKAGQPTTVCLNCHQNYGQFSGGEGFGAGGDFYWITKTFSWTAHSSTHYSYGDNHGHNVVSDTFGIPAETLNATGVSPGGSYPSDSLSCASCHDPHGSGFERLLRAGDDPPPEATADWHNDPPDMLTTSFRTTGGSGVTDSSHTVYGLGMSAWCSNCHATFLHGTAEVAMHPADENLGTEHANNYNGYRSTSNPTGNGSDGAYLELTPFAVVDLTGLTTSSVEGPNSNDQVICLTCHRAHATAFPNSGRWDFETEAPVEGSHPATGDTGVIGNDVFNSYYGRDMLGQFGADQRSFCNKCHVKDTAG